MVQQNTAKKESITLESMELTPEDIKKHQLESSDLYYFSLNNNTYGPIYKEALKNNLDIIDPTSAGMVKQADENTWQSPYTHPYFQRRRLQIVDNDIEVNGKNSFYLLDQSGIKRGPVSFETIELQIKEKQLMLNDLISLDEGKTWIKLYQIEQFDRRKLVAKSALPDLPTAELLDVGQEQNDYFKEDETEEAIIGLAIITNTNANKAQDKAYHHVTEEYVKIAERKLKSSTFPIILAIACFIGSIVWYLGLEKSNEIQRQTTDSDTKISSIKPTVYNPAQKAVIKRVPATSGTSLGKSKVTNRINPALPNTRSYQKKAFKDSDSYIIRDDINETAVTADFVDGETLLPEAQLSDQELLELESKLSNRFNVTPVENSDGPASEEGLFDEETSY